MHSLSLLIDLIFLKSFRFTAKLSGCREFSYICIPTLHIPSVTIYILHQSGTFFPNGELILKQSYPKSTVYMRTQSWCFAFCGSNNCVMTYVHQWKIIHNSFTPLKSFVPPVSPSFFPNPWGPLTFFISFAFSRMSHRICNLFKWIPFT